jgi:hypothetical protein
VGITAGAKGAVPGWLLVPSAAFKLDVPDNLLVFTKNIGIHFQLDMGIL